MASILVAGSIGCAFATPAGAAGARDPASQPLVVLLHDHVARAKPSGQAARIEAVAPRRPLTGARTVLPVLGRAGSRHGGSWLRVRLPGRPNENAEGKVPGAWGSGQTG